MKEKKFTYHWVIVIACFLMMFASIGIGVNCFSVLANQLVTNLDLSVGGVQLIHTVNMLTGLVAGLFLSKLFSKFNMRVVMTIGAACFGILYFCFSFATELWQFYLISFFVGLSASTCSTIPCAILLGNWFASKKGTAMGIAFTGSVVGGMVLTQFTKFILTLYDWRMAYRALGVLSFVVLVFTALVLVREKPEDKGLRPAGEAIAPVSGARGVTFKAFVKTPYFWTLAISCFFISFANMGISNNVNIYFTKGLGCSVSFAANVFTIVMLAQIFGKILLGMLYDKKGIKFSAIVGMLFYVGGVVLLLFSGTGAIGIAFAVVFGLVASMTTVTPPFITSQIVGQRAYTAIYAWINVFTGLGAAFGGVFVGKMYDITKSFNSAFIVLGVLAVIAAVTTIISASKKDELSTAE